MEGLELENGISSGFNRLAFYYIITHKLLTATELTTSADKISSMSTMASGHASKQTKSTVFCSDEEFDGIDQDDYGDFALGTSKAAHGKGSKKTKMTGNNGPYSTKHTRLRESRKSGK